MKYMRCIYMHVRRRVLCLDSVCRDTEDAETGLRSRKVGTVSVSRRCRWQWDVREFWSVYKDIIIVAV